MSETIIVDEINQTEKPKRTYKKRAAKVQPVDIQPQCTCKKSQQPTNVSVTTTTKQTGTPTEKQLTIQR